MSMPAVSNLIPSKIRDAVSGELERRVNEAEDYLEITQDERSELHADLVAVIAAAVKKQHDDADPETVAGRAAAAAAAVVESAVAGIRRRPIERAVAAAVESAMRAKLDQAAKYLQLLEAGRADREHRLGWSLTELFRERLDACEDWVTLDLHDWARVRAIVLPERGDAAFRRYSAEALALWGRFCRTVLPESYCDPATVPLETGELPGTWSKVEVMGFRESAGVCLRSSKDAVLAEDAGMIAPQSLADGNGYSGNGKKDARMIGGERAEKSVVSLKGCPLRPPTPAEEWDDEAWWRLRPPTPSQPTADEPLPPFSSPDGLVIVSVDVLPDHPDDDDDEPVVTVVRQEKKRGRRRCEAGPWLPFDAA